MQIGPGTGDGGGDADYWRTTGEKAFLEDFSSGRVTVRPEDGFKFRTPTLRNVELTGKNPSASRIALPDICPPEYDVPLLDLRPTA